MEMKNMRYVKNYWWGLWLYALMLLLPASYAFAQPRPVYTIKNGRMYVQLEKDIRFSALDSFVTGFDLRDLGLFSFIKSGKKDSMEKQGWRIEADNETGFVISKIFEPFKGLDAPDDKMFFKDKPNPLFPAVNNGVVFGVNQFKNKSPFFSKDSITRFFLRNHKNAKQVMLAGSFNNWIPGELVMQRTDSGWIYDVKIGIGKWWYKFIVDGDWIVDKDNQLAENDGLGNTNSVFYRTNVLFSLPGFQNAKKVFLAGNFANWEEGKLRMKKTAEGWELPLYLAEGTHTYKFIADDRWYADPNNREALPDGTGEFNSVVRLGNSHTFKLPGYENAKEVMLAGSFNQWRDFELTMKKSASGWELPYSIGPGNYEYKFRVDGKWISDPANALSSESTGNSFLIISPNYTFRLKGFTNAKKVFLAGDFNFWDIKAFAMKKEGDEWIFPVHLSVGKHLYKFIVDDNWILDPGNKLWEENEHGTGNSIVWVEK
jgi:hypothetical protein